MRKWSQPTQRKALLDTRPIAAGGPASSRPSAPPPPPDRRSAPAAWSHRRRRPDVPGPGRQRARRPGRQGTAAPLRGLAPAAAAAAAQPRRSHHLRPARHGPATGACRRRLLGWLRELGLTLAAAPIRPGRMAGQRGRHPAKQKPVTSSAGRSPTASTDLQFTATRWTGPARLLDQDERWQQARWLVHDDTLSTGDRVAGLLVLLSSGPRQMHAAHPR